MFRGDARIGGTLTRRAAKLCAGARARKAAQERYAQMVMQGA